MTTDSIILIAIAAILGALIVKRAAWFLRRQQQDTPVSRQWLLDQRVREE